MGHVPKPPVVQSWVNKEAGTGPNGPRAGQIVGSCHHTMVGFLQGTDQWFHNPGAAALTDYGVGGPWDGELDGVIYEWIDPESQIVPWANGSVGTAKPPFGDAPAFLNAFGVEAVNRRLRSIETSDGSNGQDGQWDRDKGGREIESLCFLTAWIHAEQAGQTADTFAWNMQHREFGVDHQQCPGAWIINHVDEIQARTKAIMRAYQEGAPLDPPLLVTYPPGWTGGQIPPPETGGQTPQPAPQIAQPGEGTFVAFQAVRTFTATRGAVGRLGPSRDYEDGSRLFQGGETLTCDGYQNGQFIAQFNDGRWLRTTDAPPLYVHSSGASEPI